ncbi:hypothetical protein CEXT_465551 [Caerostris extrusa]|uniref:Uncharacterized protein n=1 Tax=Caerostris extrusa TaxID=172846 RepID=A0AAV4NPV4_CAEEX|nr:hypothetical protein CEXT_465551 [Caerostris extrusa]
MRFPIRGNRRLRLGGRTVELLGSLISSSEKDDIGIPNGGIHIVSGFRNVSAHVMSDENSADVILKPSIEITSLQYQM